MRRPVQTFGSDLLPHVQNHKETHMVRVNHIDKHIGGRLRAIRAAKGLKADALCRSVRGLSMDCLERLENGDQRLSAERMRQLCQALNVTSADFFRGLISEPIADHLPALVAEF